MSHIPAAFLKRHRITKVGFPINGVSEYRLKNGLKILLAPDNTFPVVTFNTVFRVGSRNEATGNTGATHLLEHHMFKGTPKFNPQRGTDYWELLVSIGSKGNATTWNDRTTYFETLPSAHLELVIRLNADRMRNLRLRQVDHDAEMTVVRNELELGENSIGEVLESQLTAIAIREHTYHHPTIGWRSDVENMGMGALRKFYDTYYWPNNCTVILVGDFSPQEALLLIKKYYGRIPHSPHVIPEVYTVEPEQEGERSFTLRRAGETKQLLIGYHVPAAGHDDHHALMVLGNVLGGSEDRNSEIYKALIETELATEADCHHPEFRDPSLLYIKATAANNVELAQIVNAIDAVVAKLSSEPIANERLDEIKLGDEKGSFLARDNQADFASALAEAEGRADWRWLMDYDNKFQAVTAARVMEVAKKYLQVNTRTIGFFIPSESETERSQ